MRIRKSVAILFVGLMLAACTYNVGLVQTTYKLLLTSQVSYDTGMKIAADQERLTAQIEVATTALSKLLELLRPYLEVK